jgi:ketosteroid isomerase-like protein
MQSSHAWVLFVAGLGTLYVVSPAPPVNAAVGDRSFRTFLQDVEHKAARQVDHVSTVVSGDLAYTVAIERSTVRPPDAPATTATAQRVTQVFRKEDGRWKLLHRDVDPYLETTGPASVSEP